nr:pyruvate, phosphate dikinase, chloroplastic isoform X1 [Tanacetum cinerariifolium]
MSTLQGPVVCPSVRGKKVGVHAVDGPLVKTKLQRSGIWGFQGINSRQVQFQRERFSVVEAGESRNVISRQAGDAMQVTGNADTPNDVLTARNNGAQWIGLCRIEHMFFSSDERIKAVRKMMKSVTIEQRRAALDHLLFYERLDFEGIFRAMNDTDFQ